MSSIGVSSGILLPEYPPWHAADVSWKQQQVAGESPYS